MPRGGSRKGEHRSPGRPKGSQNKIPRELKEMILDALADKGGVSYLVEQAGANPTAFLTLIGKVLPIQQQHSGPDGAKTFTFTWKSE